MSAMHGSTRTSRFTTACALLALGAACADDTSGLDDVGESSSSESTGDSTPSTTTPSTTVADTTVADTSGTSSATDSASSSSAGSESSSSESTGGPATACIASSLPGPIENAAWDDRFSIAGLAGRDGYIPSAYDIAVDTDGTLLFAGYFRWGDGEAMEAIAAHDETGWSAPMASWGALELPTAGFSAVGVGPEGQLALATYDLAMDGDGEIWADTGAGPELIGNHAGAVRRLLWKDGELWAVGRFQLADGGPIGLARWDGSMWSGAPGGDPDADVFEILDDGEGAVIVGGEFTQIGGIAAQRVARWDGAVWEALDMPESARVLALERDDEGVLHAGGLFLLDPANMASSSLARWTGTAWERVAGGVAAGIGTGVVSDLEHVDGSMYVTGCFDQLGGAIASDGVARLVDGAWENLADPAPFGTPWFQEYICGFEPDPDVVFLMPKQRLHHDGERLWVAGAFPGIDEAASQSVAVLDDGGWRAADEAGLGIGGTVQRLAQGGASCDTYALVGASHVAGEPWEGSVARFDGTTWQEAAPSLGDRFCPDFTVRGSGEIVVGCAGGDLLHPDGDSWETIDTLPGSVQQLALASDDTVWLAGGDATGFVAHYDDGAPTIVEDGFDGFILRMAVGSGGDVVVGGGFANVGDIAANRIAYWDGASWSALGDGLVATPSVVAIADDGIYAGSYDEGVPGRFVLARWDGSAWVELATPENGLAAPMGESSHTFTGLEITDDGLVATGYVWPETGARNAYLLDDEGFHDLMGGIAAISVDDALVTDDGIWFAGSIAEVGDGESLRSSVGVARLGW